MRYVTRPAGVLLALALVAAFDVGCANPASPDPSRTAPTATVTAPATSTGGWDVRIQTAAVTGPDFCLYTPGVGSVFQGNYDLAWSGDVVAFAPPDPIDWDSFTATLSGADFSATNPPADSGGGMCAHYVQSSKLSGRFSADRNAFSATEVLSYTLDSGQMKTITFLWSGTRR